MKRKLMKLFLILLIITFPLILYLDSLTFGGKTSNYILPSFLELLMFFCGIIYGYILAKSNTNEKVKKEKVKE